VQLAALRPDLQPLLEGHRDLDSVAVPIWFPAPLRFLLYVVCVAQLAQLLIRQLHADLLLKSAYAGPNSSLRSQPFPSNIPSRS
jgi:hypothetical protein